MIRKGSQDRVSIENAAASCIVKTAALLCLLCLLAACPLPDFMQNSAQAESSDIVTLELDGSFIIDSTRQMLDDINNLRANDAWYWNSSDTEKITVSGLVPLEYDYGLERVAMQRAAELAVFYSHSRPDLTSCGTAYPSEIMGWGENIAFGYSGASSVFTAWAEADEPYAGQGHRRNMLSGDFTTVGIGCFVYDGVLYWAQEFGSNHSSTTASNPLVSPVSINVTKQLITNTTIGDQIALFEGDTLDIPFFSISFAGQYISGSTIRLPVSADDCHIEDTSVAMITDGKIVARSVGETKLTITLGGLTASTVISVIDESELALSLDTPINISIPAGKTIYLSFTPAETGSYVFSSSGSYDTIGCLYDSNKNVLKEDDDSGDNTNFAITSELTAGTLYYYSVRLYNTGLSATISVKLENDPSVVCDGFTYIILDDGTASITACSLSGDIVIPETLNGYTVTNLARQLFYGRSRITSVTIPATVTYFGTDKSDNDWDYVFSYCDDLKNIHVDSGNTVFSSIDGVLYNKAGTKLINYPCAHEGTVYHTNAATLCCTSFANNRNLRFLFLENRNAWWYTYTFFGMSGLTTFYAPGGNASQKASDDTSSPCTFVSTASIATLPSGLKRIESQAYQNTGLKYLIVPSGCERIEAGAFEDSSLVYVSVGSGTVIENGAFGSSVVVERR